MHGQQEHTPQPPLQHASFACAGQGAKTTRVLEVAPFFALVVCSIALRPAAHADVHERGETALAECASRGVKACLAIAPEKKSKRHREDKRAPPAPSRSPARAPHTQPPFLPECVPLPFHMLPTTRTASADFKRGGLCIANDEQSAQGRDDGPQEANTGTPRPSPNTRGVKKKQKGNAWTKSTGMDKSKSKVGKRGRWGGRWTAPVLVAAERRPSAWPRPIMSPCGGRRGRATVSLRRWSPPPPRPCQGH